MEESDTHPNVIRRDREVREILEDTALRHAVLQGRERRWRYVYRKEGIYLPLQFSPLHELDPQVEQDLDAALVMGYHGALLSRFRELKNLSDDWFTRQRRSGVVPALDGRDRRYDYELTVHYYPELRTYYPEEPIRRAEVLEQAENSLWDLLCSPGTDYCEAVREQRVFPNNYTKLWDYLVDSHPDRGLIIDKENNHTIYVRPDRSNPLLHDSVLSVVARLICDYGPRPALYWTWRTLYDSSYKDHYRLLEFLGNHALGDPGFDGYRKDLDRKMKLIDADVQSWVDDGSVPDLVAEGILSPPAVGPRPNIRRSLFH